MSEVVGKCEICKEKTKNRCANCHEIFYCCKQHQKLGWKSHKKVCRPFKICVDSTLGRHLVATRDIDPTEIILKENPLIWGPSQHTIPVCLGCGKAVTETSSRPCSKCGWPMCSELCEKAPEHIPECRYTVLRGDKVSIKNFNIIHPTYQCITVLRCLYQKQFLPDVWKKLDTLQSHCEERKKTQRYEQEKTNIAKFIQRFFKLSNTFSEEEIMRVCGIVMVNSHEVPLTDTPHIAIYDQTSMFQHDCSANCSKSFTNSSGVLVTAGKMIKKGEHLSICYTDPLWGTPCRRHHLHESKFFWCSCVRCADKTEFGTYFSALKCQQTNCNGYLLPKTFLEPTTFTNANSKTSDWYCGKCNYILSSYSVQDTLERIGKDLTEMPKGDVAECRKFIQTYEELLSPSHYYLTDVKIAMLHLIGQGNDDKDDNNSTLIKVSDDDLELKATICQSLSQLVETLIPGEKRIRGLILFELHTTLTEMGRRKGDPVIFQAALMESKRILMECVELLKNEPDQLPEGKIYKQAVRNLTELNLILKNF